MNSKHVNLYKYRLGLILREIEREKECLTKEEIANDFTVHELYKEAEKIVKKDMRYKTAYNIGDIIYYTECRFEDNGSFNIVIKSKINGISIYTNKRESTDICYYIEKGGKMLEEDIFKTHNEAILNTKNKYS